jgi:hypothetical protein
MKARTRLFKEFKEAQRDATADADFQLLADDTNIYNWKAFLKVWARSHGSPPCPNPMRCGHLTTSLHHPCCSWERSGPLGYHTDADASPSVQRDAERA